MELKLLDLENLRALYRQRLEEDFPPAELRPLSNMEYLLDRGVYRCYEAWEDGRRLGYALCTVHGGAALLDYFAVEPDLRGQGIGGRFLRELKDLDFGAQYLLIEAESLSSAATPGETAQRTRRLSFYRHCGCRDTGVLSLLFGVEYEILLLPLREGVSPAPAEVKAVLEGLYRCMIPQMLDFDEAALDQVRKVYFRPKEDPAPRNFARELGLSVTYLIRSRSRFMGERLKEYGFAGAMYNILLYVDRNPGATQDAIATHMYIDKSNVARRIKQLEELGYVRRETDPADRRQNNLYLTDSGRELAPVIRSTLGEWSRAIAADLTDDERETLLTLLSKMKQ